MKPWILLVLILTINIALAEDNLVYLLDLHYDNGEINLNEISLETGYNPDRKIQYGDYKLEVISFDYTTIYSFNFRAPRIYADKSDKITGEIDGAVMDKYYTKSRKSYIHSRFQNTTGYGWVFPKKKHLNIGLGNLWSTNYDIDNKNVKKHYHAYISYLKNNKLIPKNLKPVKIKGGALPFYPLEKTYGNRIILVGDAGGFINPISGEGIYYAMTSGEIAAKVIIEALGKKEINEKFLSKFQKSWKKEFGKDLNLMYKALKRPIPKEIDRSFEIVKSDQKLKEIFIGITTGELSINKYKWNIILRHIIASIKIQIKRNLNRGQSKIYNKAEKKTI